MAFSASNGSRAKERRYVPCLGEESRIVNRIGVSSRSYVKASVPCWRTRRCAGRHAEALIGSPMTRACDARFGDGQTAQRSGSVVRRAKLPRSTEPVEKVAAGPTGRPEPASKHPK